LTAERKNSFSVFPAPHAPRVSEAARRKRCGMRIRPFLRENVALYKKSLKKTAKS
jgi:hypothetical protein